jgi:glycosyltransferase involved in cell wall biosynthesis
VPAMRVLINAVSSARHPSGICRHAANLARSLAKRVEISQITLLAGKWQQPYFRTAFGLCDPKLEIAAIDITRGPLDRNRWYLQGLPMAVKVYSPDILHLSFPIPILRSRFACPIIASLHDLYPYDAPANFGFPQVLFNRLFVRQCLQCSDAIACGSDATLNRLRSLMPRVAAKARRIYQCVDLDPANMRDPLLAEIKGRPFFLSVAQHRRNKNLKLLVNTFAELLERGAIDRNTCLLVVGSEGPETPHLEDLVRRRSLENQVHFKASITDSELCWLYANCAAFIAPSTMEGFGMPVIEAVRCGCRIVCSDIPVFREIAGAACRFFDLQSLAPTTALADAICAALRAPWQPSETLNRFSADEVGAQYVSLYSHLLGAGASCTQQVSAHRLGQAVGYDRFAD